MTGAADTTDIPNFKDLLTSVPIYSVYGDTDAKRHPPMDVIRKLDVIVFDLQDVGARFYTYETTLGYFLEAAAKAKKPIVVLDRPDPITGAYVQGPVSDAGQESLRQLLSASGAAWHDHGRAGQAFQRGEAHRRQSHCDPHARLDARRLVRLHRRFLGESIAEPAQPGPRRRSILAWR